MKFGEAFRAIAALQQKGLAGRDRRLALLEPTRLAGKDERREAMQCLLDAGKRCLIGVTRNLPDRQTPPAVRRPYCSHFTSSPRNRFVNQAPRRSYITSEVGSYSTFGDIRISKSMKHESRLWGRLREKRASAILCRQLVPAVVKSRHRAGVEHRAHFCHGRTLWASASCGPVRIPTRVLKNGTASGCPRVRDAGGPAMRKDIDGDEFAPDIERGIPRGGQPETLPHFSEVVVSSC